MEELEGLEDEEYAAARDALIIQNLLSPGTLWDHITKAERR